MKPIKTSIDPEKGIYLVTQLQTDSIDQLVQQYKDKIFLLPSVEDDGLALIKFYFEPDASSEHMYTEIFQAHLSHFVNFFHFILCVINAFKIKGNVVEAVHNYFNSLGIHVAANYNVDHITTCPCCGSKLFIMNNGEYREYCVNANCAQFNFYPTLCNKLSILTKHTCNPDKQFLKKLIELHVPRTQSLAAIDTHTFSSLNLQQVLLTLITQYSVSKLTRVLINTLNVIRIDAIFQLFKIPNVIAEDVYNYLYSTIIPHGSNLFDDIKMLRSLIYHDNMLTGISDVDKYFYYSLEVNSMFIDSLFYIKH